MTTTTEAFFTVWEEVSPNVTSWNDSVTVGVEVGNATDEAEFCGEGLARFQAAYRQLHGYLSLLVCVFGSVANSLNIAVLTRREMVSATNSILTGLAVADLLVMLEYVPYALHTYVLVRPREVAYTYGWAAFVLFHCNFAQACHTVSILLTVALAVWRYVAVSRPRRAQAGASRALAAVAGAYLLGPLLCAPHFLAFEVAAVRERGATLHVVRVSRLGGGLLADLNFWVYAVAVKLAPCAALSALSLRLVGALLDAERRRRRLGPAAAKGRHTERTTRMLLAVLALFLATELPQGVLGLLSGLLGERFFAQCYVPLGELMDGLALLNSAVNFVLYCSMSRQFRATFRRLFRPRALHRWRHADASHTAAATATNNATQETQL